MDSVEKDKKSPFVQLATKCGEIISKVKQIDFKSKKTITVLFVGILIMGAVSVSMVIKTISNGASALHDGYFSSFNEEKDATYNKFYKKYYDEAKEQYHVSNDVSIALESIKEIAELEVLSVSDVEYIVEDKSDNSNGIYSWLEVSGNGVYVINLQAAEFIVDADREYILVRAPLPELTNITIDYANVKKLFFKNDLLNDSYKVGEDLARKQLSTADMLIKKEFASNEHYFLNAQAAAVSAIQCLVKQLNPGVTNLVVEVEFY